LFEVGFDRYLACQASQRETFTQCQKTQIIQRQVDFWLKSDGLQDDVISQYIKPSIKSVTLR